MEQGRMPVFEYLCTYGPHEFISGTLRFPAACTVAQFLTQVMGEHTQEIAKANKEVGTSKNEMYNQFASRQAQLEITCHRDGTRDDRGDVYNLGVADNLQVPVDLDCYYLHFHLRAHNWHSIAPQSDYRRRLTAFYTHWNPTKLMVIDGMLYDARGFEEELMRALVARYGPEPTGEGGVDVRFRDRLEAFYQYYNPERVPFVDVILDSYRGMEEQLFTALVGKYGPEPVIMGSELGTDDSYTFTADSEPQTAPDLHPLAVPIMPLDQPLPEEELPPEQPELQYDVHFWDAFVNQMSSEHGDDFGMGMDCNQDMLRQFIRSYPVLFPHVLTLTCPFKEKVFKASEDFWVYCKARSEGQAEQVRRAVMAGGEHVVRIVSSLDANAACVLTRREWQALVTDWEAAHDIVRRVNVGSVAIDAVPELDFEDIAERKLSQSSTPTGPPPETSTKLIQTVCDGGTQTTPADPPLLAAPSPVEPDFDSIRRGVSGGDGPAPVFVSPKPRGMDLADLPIAWPISSMANAYPETSGPSSPPPPAADNQPESWLADAIRTVPSVSPFSEPPRVQAMPSPGGVTSGTQTSGWVPPQQGRASQPRETALPSSPPVFSPPPQQRSQQRQRPQQQQSPSLGYYGKGLPSTPTYGMMTVPSHLTPPRTVSASNTSSQPTSLPSIKLAAKSNASLELPTDDPPFPYNAADRKRTALSVPVTNRTPHAGTTPAPRPSQPPQQQLPQGDYWQTFLDEMVHLADDRPLG